MKRSNPPTNSTLGGDLTPQQARDARARALRYVLDRYFEKQKAAKTGGDEGSGERRASSKRDKDLRQ